MNFNPTPESEVQGLHAALGALFVVLPTAVLLHHPTFLFGHPQIAGSFIGFVYAAVKEFSWDQHMEDAITRGSNWLDFAFYAAGIAVGNLILYV
jgi:hypothetical protein